MEGVGGDILHGICAAMYANVIGIGFPPHGGKRGGDRV
jgi:hypothetical protein